eukprot:5186595-Pyramimonas_sp.AAC.1
MSDTLNFDWDPTSAEDCPSSPSSQVEEGVSAPPLIPTNPTHLSRESISKPLRQLLHLPQTVASTSPPSTNRCVDFSTFHKPL